MVLFGLCDYFTVSSPFSPDKYSINPETGRVQPKIRQYPVDQSSSLPKINSKGYLLGTCFIVNPSCFLSVALSKWLTCFNLRYENQLL